MLPRHALYYACLGDAFDGAGTFLFVYVAGPLVGALLAGFAYQAIVIAPQDRIIDREGRIAGRAGGTPGERPVDKLSGEPEHEV